MFSFFSLCPPFLSFSPLRPSVLTVILAGAHFPSSAKGAVAITKPCTVRIAHLDLDVKSILKMDNTLLENSSANHKETAKRDNENVHDDGPLTKKQKSDDIVVIESDTKPLERALKPVTPDVTVTKLKSPPKELLLTAKRVEAMSALSPPETRPKIAGEKPTLQRTPSFDSAKKSDNTQKSAKMSSASSSSSSSSSGSTNHDRTDRTSLQCLEQKLLDLKQKAQAKSDKAAAAELHTSKPKSHSPSGLKPSKELFHRRKEDFITERKKSSLSPIKKPIKKSLSLPASKDNKMGNLFCPTTDAKVTILPCNKPNGKDMDVKPPSAANSVTITKLSSGDSLNVPPKDIKKMFNSKSEMKTKDSSHRMKLSAKNLSRTEKHRDHKSREKSRDGEGKSKHIGCSKCREQFSTKEAKKLHTCNSILDAHYLIDGGDRQKTSPTSSVSTSESNSASLSRSSSRSSSPGIPSTVPVKKSSQPSPGETPKLKISMKGDKSDKPKIRKEDSSEKLKVKRDSMKEKWVESKPSQKSDLHGEDLVTKDDRTRITIEAMKPNDSESLDLAKGPAAALNIVRMEGGKEEAAVGAPDRIDHAFAFTGKRTYSPSMSETASVEGKGES